MSDPTGTLATPIEVVQRPRSKEGLQKISALVASKGIERVVVGLPVGLSGDDTDQTREARSFADALRGRLAVPVEMYDERFTTAIAAKSGGSSADEDSRAAAVLLEDWLARNA